MDDLEQMFRDSFERHAQEADTAIEVPERRRRVPWLVPLAAAAAVALVAVGIAVLRDDGPGSAPILPSTEIPSAWRVEQWHGIQVSVPPEWGWGGAPVPDGPGRGEDELLDCGASAFVRPNGEKILNVNRELPYVGRPGYQTDVCMMYRDRPVPEAPYAWLGVELPVGTVDLGDGWTQETIEVAGETVTAATNDERLRALILSSARLASDPLCDASLPGPPTGSPVNFPLAGGLAVCVYEPTENGASPLIYATRVGRAAADEFFDALPGSEVSADHCQPYPHDWVVLHVLGADGSRHGSAAIQMHSADCASFITLGGEHFAVTPQNVASWAVDGVPAYVTGPGDARFAPYFRGMLG